MQSWDVWSRTTDYKITWKLVDNSRDADVICGWTTVTTHHGNAWEAGNTGLRIIFNRLSKRGEIVNAEVKILTKFEGPLTDRELRRVCLHEVGHALGLQGHSPNPDDVMYPVATFIQRTDLSSRDVKTIRLLYAGYPSHAPEGKSAIAGESTTK